MDFLKDYKYREIENGFLMLELIPVKKFPEIMVCIDKKDDTIIIFDGGSTIGVLCMIYNFSSNIVKEKFIDIAKRNRISSKDDVIYLHCTKDNFSLRLKDFIKALNEFCRM